MNQQLVPASNPDPSKSPAVLAAPLTEWTALRSVDGRAPDEPEGGFSARALLNERLAAILQSDELVILAGSGASFAVGSVSEAGAGHRAPSMQDLWTEATNSSFYPAAACHLSSSVKEESPGNFEHLLSEAQARLALDPNSDLERFIKDAEAAVLSRCSFVDEQSDTTVHQAFLRKIARRSARLHRTEIYTTNYDLAFETAARRARFNVIDGFGFYGAEFDGSAFDIDYVRRGSNEQLALEPNVLHLLKLHGSVNWENREGRIFKTTSVPTTPVLIYPSSTKYQQSYQEPYLEFMARFQISLRKPDVGVIVVGFGFNDDHLTAPIEAAIRSNVGLKLAVVAPDLHAAPKASVAAGIEQLVKLGDQRLTLINGTFDNLVQELPDVPAASERDLHNGRVEQVWTNTGKNVGA